jgi:taurine dioxygenase
MTVSAKATANHSPNTIDVGPIAGTIGAEISGVDLSRNLDANTTRLLQDAFLEHLVIFITGQPPLDPDQLKAFAALFGEIDRAPFVHPFKTPSLEGHPEVFNIVKEPDSRAVNIGGFWHADVTYRERPHLGALLYAREVPAFGGDTMFANQYLAYETLSDGMKEMLSSMRAIHSSAMPHGQEEVRFAAVARDHAPVEGDRSFDSPNLVTTRVDVIETAHPVIRTHPDTGRKALYVNRAFTERFEGATVEESLPLLRTLWDHAARPEFTCRYRWRTGTVALWDNRVTQHYAINDYFGQRRHMQRIAIHEPTRPA